MVASAQHGVIPRAGGKRPAGLLIVSVGVYLILSLSIAWTKAPWCDEGWFANPSYNLAFRGNMGTNVLEPSGHFLNAYLSGIHERTYIVTPNHVVALAAWFRVFGFSLLRMRAFSIFWGVVIMLAMYSILLRLFPNPWVAHLAALLTSIDFIFQWATADGRMESFATALSLCSLAAYLHFRERNFRAAVVISQSLLAAAVFTHPNSLMIGFAVFAVALCYDRKRLQPAHLALAVLPYLVFGALWGIYILQSPADFKAQFLANAAGRDSARWKAILHPWTSVLSEIARHVDSYIRSSLWGAEMTPQLVFVQFIYLGANIWLLKNWRRHQSPVRIFVLCAVTVMCGLTFLNGFKAPAYLLYVLPFYNAILAAWLVSLWERSGDPRGVALVLGFVFAFLQITSTITHIRADEYHRDYLPTVRELAADRASGRTILGTAALGFGMGFSGFADDWRLGIYSGLKPDVLVVDRSYREFIRRFIASEPGVFSHALVTLTCDYRVRSRHGSFWILDRVPEAERSPVQPVDMSSLTLKDRQAKADVLFDRLGGVRPPAEGKKSSL